ncbi:MAG: hypothetical protein NVS9B15_18140 [Acidobacteriaceae bacterium]
MDTNILLRLGDSARPSDQQIHSSLAKLQASGFHPCYTVQNVCEYWNVCTSSQKLNGLELSIQETARRLAALRSQFELLPSNEKVEEILLWLLTSRSVIGTKVHDCHLIATMLAHDIESLLTLNTQDFSRYTDLVRILHPSDVLADEFSPA